ncbi:MAG: PQQ-binding-like beta-propeller repeat protein, partial [Bryobacterales bacterium]|nr:PQQ-binding-like beta-propeller repeat protein [Bryobacterales bacterium]
MAFASFVVSLLLFADWPAFRGPNGSGIADNAPLPAKLAPVWKTELPPGLSSPVVVGDRIYLTGLDSGQLATLALDRQSGRILWQRVLDRPRSEKLHKLNHPASPSVAVGGGSLYSFFPDFGLISYTVQGAERWRVPLGPFTNSYGLGTSPVLAGDKLILSVDQDRDSFIAAFDAVSGRPLWRTPRPEAISGHSTPILYKNWVIAPGSFRMDAYDVATGR